jgi:hypothetical protein
VAQWGVATAVTSPASGGHPDGYLNMHFDPTPTPSWQIDIMGTTDYAGDYTQLEDPSVAFDFLGYPTSAQSLYFESTAGGGSAWVYDLDVDTNTWQTYVVSLSDPTGWTQVSGSESFYLALTEVTLMGIIVEHLNVDMTFDYGLDNWRVFVPEPGVLAMIFTTLASIGITFRHRFFRFTPGSPQPS